MVDSSITRIAQVLVLALLGLPHFHHSDVKRNKKSVRKTESFKNLFFRRQRPTIIYGIVSMHFLCAHGWVTFQLSSTQPTNTKVSEYIWTFIWLPESCGVEAQTFKIFSNHLISMETAQLHSLKHCCCLKSVFCLDKHFIITVLCWVCLPKHFKIIFAVLLAISCFIWDNPLLQQTSH